jgi:hypothetical protein
MEAQTNKLRTNTSTWTTFLITSSNSSLYDKLTRLKSTADGELRRLIELRINRPLDIGKATSDAIFGALNDNYGVAGPPYIKYVLNNMADVIALVKSFQNKFDEILELDQSDRFYSLVLACIFAGGSISSTLNLHRIPIAPVFDYAVSQVRTIRQDVVLPVSDFGGVASEALAIYINDNIQNGLVINKANANGIPTMALQVPRGPLKFRFEPDTNEVWIPVHEFKDFLVSRQIDTRQAIKEYIEMGYLKNGQGVAKRITAGAIAGLEAGVVRSYCFDAKAIGISKEAFEIAARTEGAADPAKSAGERAVS